MGYRMIYTFVGTKKIHFPINMDLKEDNKTMEYTVHIPEQRLKVAMECVFEEPVWVGPTKWDCTEESKPKESKPKESKLKEQRQDNRELPMLGEAYW